MSTDHGENADMSGEKELTPEEARKKREHLLALAPDTIIFDESAAQEVDAADAALATLILPGG